MSEKPSAILVAALQAPPGVDPDEPPDRTPLDALQPIVAEHDGTMMAMPGLRMVAQFSNAFAAVSCAVALQRSPVGDCGALRIGVDVGAAISDGETVVGDAVYVAARLQEMASPGNVFISGAVHDRASGRAGLAFESLGSQSLTDRSEPLRVYRIEPDPEDKTETKRSIEDSPEVAPEADQAADQIAPELAQAGRPRNLNAERQAQKAYWLYHRNNQADTAEAQKLFWAALDADPQYAVAAAGIALCLLTERQRGWSADAGRALIKADAVARRVVSLAPKYAYGRVVLGEVALFRNDLDKAAAEAKEALILQPALADAHTLDGLVKLVNGGFDAAIEALEHALTRDPSERQLLKALPGLAAAYYQKQRYEVAERVALRAWGVARDHWLVRQILAASRGQLGYLTGAPLIDGIRNDEPLLTRRDFAARLYYRDAAARAHVEQGLRKAGWDDGNG
ncbi:MAG: hypothetical protein JO021_04270 [Alphaproteobacteria bacterium]|nr:hypothetical protein [Alphaproteobacteria bacterium]